MNLTLNKRTFTKKLKKLKEQEKILRIYQKNITECNQEILLKFKSFHYLRRPRKA